MNDWKPFVAVLLASWPDRVNAWGREGIAAYCGELEARGLTPEAAIAAVRTFATAFPPAAGEVAAAGTPPPPAFTEAFAAIYGRRGALKLATYVGFPPDRINDGRVIARANETHPLIGGFVGRYGIRRLQLLEVDHPDYGAARRRELNREWDQYVAANAGRDRAALAAGAPRAGGLSRLDPARMLGTNASSHEVPFHVF